jgi:hypothetical protein
LTGLERQRDNARVLPKTPDDLTRHARALERFKLSSQAEDAQRKREVEDLKFVDFDEQWPDDIKAQRAGTQGFAGLPSVPARPCLTINKLLQPVEQIANQGRQSRMALSFSPKSSGADQDTAEAFEDIVRAIQANSRAHLARQWAFERAAKSGRGFYRVLTEYANDGDNDLDIVYKRILNQSSVYLDPGAQEPDWSDGMWAFVTEDSPLERYKVLYPDSDLAAASTETLSGYGNDQPEWVKTTDSGTLVRVAEYFEVVRRKVPVTLYALPDGTEQNIEDGESPPEGATPVLNAQTGQPMTRTVERQEVQWSKINAIEVLDSKPWPGRYIPIIPVIGREANVNGERRWTGVVRPAKDAQMSYNFMVSAQAEGIGLAPRAPYVGYWETIEPYAAWWQQANTRNFPFLPVAPAKDANGNALPPPQRQVVEPAIQAITMAIGQADNDIKGTTGIFDPSLGNLSPSERSGKAILALQKQAEAGTGVYLDNLAQMSILYEGKILRDLIPKIYTRVGRIVPAVGADEQQRQIMLGRPFTTQNGQPVPAQPGDPTAKMIDLARGEYGVAVTVGKSYTTRRQEGVEQMGALAEAVPNLVPTFADLWVGNMDFPGARQIADRLKKTLPPGMGDSEDGQPHVNTLQQQLQQAGQMVDMLTKELEAKTKAIETDAVKAEYALRQEQLRQQAESEREFARIGAEQQIKARELEIKLEIEMAKLGSAEMLKRGEIEAEQLHQHGEMLMREQEIGAEEAQADLDRQADRDEAEASRAFQGAESAANREAGATRAEDDGA